MISENQLQKEENQHDTKQDCAIESNANEQKENRPRAN